MAQGFQVPPEREGPDVAFSFMAMCVAFLASFVSAEKALYRFAEPEGVGTPDAPFLDCSVSFLASGVGPGCDMPTLQPSRFRV